MEPSQRRVSRISQERLARMLKNYPGPPCAPRLFKSRRFRILPIQRKSGGVSQYKTLVSKATGEFTLLLRGYVSREILARFRVV